MKRILAIALVALAVPALALAGATKTSLEAKLSGAKETPKGAPSGKGYADVTINGTTVCWKFTFSGIGTPNAAHIHKGAPGVAGPVVVPLGAAFKAKGCTQAPKAQAAAIAAHPGRYYVNIHTAKYPAGAIRGQLVKET